jgi:hypothetical protein
VASDVFAPSWVSVSVLSACVAAGVVALNAVLPANDALVFAAGAGCVATAAELLAEVGLGGTAAPWATSKQRPLALQPSVQDSSQQRWMSFASAAQNSVPHSSSAAHRSPTDFNVPQLDTAGLQTVDPLELGLSEPQDVNAMRAHSAMVVRSTRHLPDGKSISITPAVCVAVGAGACTALHKNQ